MQRCMVQYVKFSGRCQECSAICNEMLFLSKFVVVVGFLSSFFYGSTLHSIFAHSVANLFIFFYHHRYCCLKRMLEIHLRLFSIFESCTRTSTKRHFSTFSNLIAGNVSYSSFIAAFFLSFSALVEFFYRFELYCGAVYSNLINRHRDVLKIDLCRADVSREIPRTDSTLPFE